MSNACSTISTSTGTFPEKAAGLADLLNYAALVDPGIIQCKDGSLMAGWSYFGPDGESQTSHERNYTTERVNAALAKLGSGWVTWTDAIRIRSTDYPAPERSAFPDPVTRAIDDQRRKSFEAEGAHFETEYIFIVLFIPPSKLQNRFVELFYDDDRTKSHNAGARLLENFKLVLSDLEDSFGSVLRMTRLTSHRMEDTYGRIHYHDDLLSYLQGLFRGEPARITAPASGMYLDAVLGGMELYPAVYPKLGDNFICVIAVEGYPEESFPGILDILAELPIRYRWSTRMIYLDRHHAIGHFENYRRKWQQKTRPLVTQIMRSDGGGRVNQDAVDMVAQADAALAEASSGIVRYGYKTTVVVLMEPDREVVEENARLIKSIFESLGFVPRIETNNVMEAWLGSLPGHHAPNVRRPLLHTLHLADMLPLSTAWPGREECPCDKYPPNSPAWMYAQTLGHTPFRVNFHVGDLGHAKLFGPSGSGKSTALCEFMAQFKRYPGASILGVDVGNTMFTLCNAAGGKHYEIDTSAISLGFAPLYYLEEPGDLSWAAEWVEMAYTLQTDLPLTPEQRTLVREALVRMRTDKGGARGISEFCLEVQNTSIRESLAFYCDADALGTLFDAKEDTMSDSLFTVVEMEALMGMSDKVVLPLLAILFRRFEKSLEGQPALLVLDEVWKFFRHKVFREKLVDWLLTLRKKNCVVLMATQSLSAAARSGILDILMENCPTTIYLPNPEADKRGTAENPGPRDFYDMFGLNDAEIDIVKNGVRKRDYYFTSPEGRRLFQLALTPMELAFTGVSSPEDIKAVRALIEAHGPTWPQEWLKVRGVDYDLAI